MPTPPPDVRAIDTLQGTRLLLPSHTLLRVGGITSLLFGLVFTGFALFWILGAAGVIGSGGGGSGGGQGQPAGPFALLFPLFGVPFVIGGLFVIATGLTLLFGRPEFETRAELFRAGIRFGPLHRSKWRSIDTIERFEINRFGSTGQSANAHVLRAHVGEDKPLNITGSQDLAWLEQLAQHIAAATDRGALAQSPPEIVTRERDPELSPDEDQPTVIVHDIDPHTPPGPPDPPPANAKLWSEQSATGTTIYIPPRGFRAKPIPALLTFAIFWLAITNGIATAFVLGFINSGGPIPAMIFALLFLSFFEAVGFGVLLHAASLARRRAIIDITDQGATLLITRSGLRKSSQQELPTTDITAIQIQNSGTSINDQPLRQVAITLTDDDPIKLLTGAPEDHLHWLAHTLRHAIPPPQ